MDLAGSDGYLIGVRLFEHFAQDQRNFIFCVFHFHSEPNRPIVVVEHLLQFGKEILFFFEGICQSLAFGEFSVVFLPGELSREATVRSPLSVALFAAVRAACWAAKGVPLRDPRKPREPALDHETTFPSWSAMVTIVLLKVA